MSLGGVQLVLSAALGFAFIAGTLVSCLVQAVAVRTAHWAPESRYRVLALLGWAPLALTAAALCATLTRSVLALVWPEYDHCLAHDHGHIHLCWSHVPAQLGNAVSAFVLSLTIGWLVATTLKGSLRVYRARRLTAQLLATSRADRRLRAHVTPLQTPLCLSVGVLRPKIVLSEGLLAQLTPRELSIVMQHETAHNLRRDTAMRLLLHATTLFMWQSARSRLLFELDVAAEQSCDEAAALATGDRLQVAATILKAERLLQEPAALQPMAVSFGSTGVERRVTALLSDTQPRASTAGAVLALLVGVASLFAASSPLHHVTETLLGALIH